MSKLVALSVCVALTGCSVAFGGGAKPHYGLALADGAISASTLAIGISEASKTCGDQQLFCLANIDHTIGAVAVGTSLVFALSAIYGATRHEAAADNRVHDLSGHALIAAHAGNCAEASNTAAQLKALDHDAYEQILADDAVHGCMQ